MGDVRPYGCRAVGDDAVPVTWLVDFGDSDECPHVRPMNDLKSHVAHHECWCGPAFDEGCWVHHAMDRREEYEEGRKPS